MSAVEVSKNVLPEGCKKQNPTLQGSDSAVTQLREYCRLMDGARNRDVIQVRDVFPYEFRAHRGRQIAQVAGDDLPRIRPGGIAVRKIVGPHAIVFAPPRQNMTADGVVKESCVDLVMKVFAWRFFDGQTFALGTVAFEVVVPLLQNKRNPAQLVFDQDEL